MFTGIIRQLGEIKEVKEEKDGAKVIIVKTALGNSVAIGDSLAINGACLTVLQTTKDSINFRLMRETLVKTNLGSLTENDLVNLEEPLTMGDTLDGHFVLGHVDGMANITEVSTAGDDKIFTLAPDPSLLPYLIPKGSVALDGVSLTIVEMKEDEFTTSLMPFTLEHTTFGQAKVNDKINIEVDMIGKYVVNLARKHA